MKPRGAPRFSRRILRASLFRVGTPSLSYNVSTMGSPEVVKQTSSATLRLACKTSSTPRFRLKPCRSSSMNCVENSCSLLARMRAMILNPTLSKVTPRQLPLLLFGCFFFQRRITIAISHSCGHVSASAKSSEANVCRQMSCFVAMTRSRKSFGAHLSISTITPSSPGALPTFMLRIASVISVAVGVSTSGAGSTLGESVILCPPLNGSALINQGAALAPRGESSMIYGQI